MKLGSKQIVFSSFSWLNFVLSQAARQVGA